MMRAAEHTIAGPTNAPHVIFCNTFYASGDSVRSR